MEEGPANRSSTAQRLANLGLALACLAVPLIATFASVLFRDHQFTFQDAGHFYYPLLERVQQEWNAGRWPLWADEASAGTPLLGNPTAAVLYPGKILFFFLPHPWAVRIFLVGHVALAFLSMWCLLRNWRISNVGSILGALSYALGMPVLSQTSNMIFLVGAAWLPLVFLASDRWVRQGQLLALPGLALVLSFQVLGGDPEAAYLGVVCALGYALGVAAARPPSALRRWSRNLLIGLIPVVTGLLVLSWRYVRVIRDVANSQDGDSASWATPWWLVAVAWLVAAAYLARNTRKAGDPRRLGKSTAGLVGAALLGLAISGAQLLPIMEYAGMSFRAAESEGFHDVYCYSAHPLQLLDAAWPNLFGSVEGGYRTWLNALPPKQESRVWMPSVYLGGLTLILAAGAFGFRDGPPWRAWLSLILVASLVAALGYHGGPLLWARYLLGWDATLGPMTPAFTWQVRTDGYLQDGDGSLYWLLTSALPGFRSFRYPPKLLVLWSLAVSGLAAAGWDRGVLGGFRRASLVAKVLLGLGLIALLASWLGAEAVQEWFDNLARPLRNSDEPLAPHRAIRELRFALGHGALIAAFTLILLLIAARRPKLASGLAIACLALDLFVSNAPRVITVPQTTFEGEPLALKLIEEAEKANPSPGPFRVERIGRWWPTGWSSQGQPRDFETITRWERDTLRPNYNLPLHVPSTFYHDTIEPMDFGLFFLPWIQQPDETTARVHKLSPGQKVWYYPRRGFDLWNTRYFIVPGQILWDNPVRGFASVVPKSTYLYPKRNAFEGEGGSEREARWLQTEDFRLLRNEAAYPRAWIVHKAYLIPKIRGLRTADRSKIMRELLYQADEFWRVPGMTVRDPKQIAWVETDTPQTVDPLLSRLDPDPSESATVVRNDPQRVEIEAELRSPGLLVVSDLYYPGWTLTVNGQPGEILRTNRAMRGVALPAGTHHLVFRYDPLSFRVGLVLSALGILTALGLAAWGWRR